MVLEALYFTWPLWAFCGILLVAMIVKGEI